MSKINKLINRFISLPKDFDWEELTKIMVHFGFEESHKGRTSGSRVRFWRKDFPAVNLHKPHGKKSISTNAMKNIKDYLEDNRFL